MTARRGWQAERHASLAAVAAILGVVALFGVLPADQGVGLVLLVAVLLVVGVMASGRGDEALVRVTVAGFGARAAVALLGAYAITLPDSTRDAVFFQQRAADLAELGPSGIIDLAISNGYQGTQLYEAIIALLYSLTGAEALLVGVSLNVLLGTLVVYNVYRIAHRLWGPTAALRAGWVAALMPPLVLYSALLLREAPVVWLLSVAVLQLVEWRHTRAGARIVVAFLAVLAASIFHTGAIVAFVGVAAALGVAELSRVTDPLVVLRERFAGIVRVALLVLLIGVLFQSGVGTSKLREGDELDVETIRARQEFLIRGDAAYLENLTPDSWVDVIWQSPIRAVALVVTPLPWQISETTHLFGFLDALVHMALIATVFRYRRALWRIWEARILILAYIALALSYGTGASNFGTGLRHRNKFSFILIVLAAIAWQEFRRQRAEPAPAAAALPTRDRVASAR